MYELVAKYQAAVSAKARSTCEFSTEVFPAVQTLFQRCPDAEAVEVRLNGVALFAMPRPHAGEALVMRRP